MTLSTEEKDCNIEMNSTKDIDGDIEMNSTEGEEYGAHTDKVDDNSKCSELEAKMEQAEKKRPCRRMAGRFGSYLGNREGDSTHGRQSRTIKTYLGDSTISSVDIDDLEEFDIDVNTIDPDVGATTLPDMEEGNSYTDRDKDDCDGDDRYYPKDSYSILALNGPKCGQWPKQKLLFFLYGLAPLVFQTGILQLMLLHLKQKRGDHEHANRSYPDFDLDCLIQIRIAQATSMLAYILFPGSSFQDVTRAIHLFPMRSTNSDSNFPVQCVRFSCILRGLQGLLAMFVVFLLVVSTHDTLAVILSFTAVNFITDLDNVAFQHARCGIFGPKLKDEARRISHKRLPDCIHRESKHVGYGFVMAFAAVVFSTLMALIWNEEDRDHQSDFWFDHILLSLRAMQIATVGFLVLFAFRLCIPI